jgi:hypothetical protein
MRNVRLFMFLSSVAYCSACNGPVSDTKEDIKASEDLANEKVKFPFVRTNNTEWEINKDDANTITVLNVLKAIESKNFQVIGDATADSIESDIDGVKFNGTKAQMMKANKDFFATLKTIRIEPQDWLSVINKDKSQEWVRVWYTQYLENLKGKRDSLNVFNDIKIKNGKITVWNEYVQHFPVL